VKTGVWLKKTVITSPYDALWIGKTFAFFFIHVDLLEIKDIGLHTVINAKHKL